MQKTVLTRGNHVYEVVFEPGVITILKDGKKDGEIVGWVQDTATFLVDRVVVKLPELPPRTEYVLDRHRVRLRSAIVEKIGDSRLIDQLDADPPVTLYKSPREGTYKGGEWVLLELHTKPVIHFCLLS